MQADPPEPREPSREGSADFTPGRAEPNANGADGKPRRAAAESTLRREVLESLEADGPRGSRSEAQPASKLAGVGLQFAGVVLLFTLGGHWLDQRLDTGPWLLLVGLVLGLVGGGLSLILSVQRTL